MYILKTKGTDKIKDYIQIRDENFALLSLVLTKSATREIQKLTGTEQQSEIEKIINNLEYGKLTKLKLQ